MDDYETRMFELGRLVAAASSFEMTLRMVFCALVDSKYAAVLAGGASADALLEDCKSLVRANREVPEHDRDALLERIARAKFANQRRNRLVHDSWSSGPGDAVSQHQSRRRDHNLRAREVEIANIREVESDLRSTAFELSRWVWDVMLSNVSLDAQLRWEDHLASMPPAQTREMAEGRYARLLAKRAAAGEDRVTRADRRTIRLVGLRLFAAAAEEPDVMQAARVRSVGRWALEIADGARPALPVAGFAAAFRHR